jgi:hypothetical protein
MFTIFKKWPEYPMGSYSDIIVAAAAVYNFVLDAGESMEPWNETEEALVKRLARVARDFYSDKDARTGKDVRMNIFRDKVVDEM